jgi:hypothetical protein
MPYTTCVAGTVITASWANANIRDQTITPFTNATTRDAAITVPVEGMLQYLADVKRFCWYNSTAWPWLPGTIIARANRATSSSATTTEIGVLRLPVGSLPAGQTVLIKTSPLALISSVGNDTVSALMRYTTDGSTPSTGSTIMPETTVQRRLTGTAIDESCVVCAAYTPGAAVNLTVLLTVIRGGGSGNAQIYASSTKHIEIMVVAAGTDPTDTGVDI